MKVTGLDGRQHNFPPKGCVPRANDTRPRSDGHLRARKFIKTMYGGIPILEEVPIPGSQMRLDFYIAQSKIAVEVQGRQHTEFVEHFHKTKREFLMAQARDQQKAEWCRDNDIELIYLPDGEDDERWRERWMGR